MVGGKDGWMDLVYYLLFELSGSENGGIFNDKYLTGGKIDVCTSCCTKLTAPHQAEPAGPLLFVSILLPFRSHHWFLNVVLRSL